MAKKKAKAKKVDNIGEAVRTHVEALSLGKQGYKTADSALDLVLAAARTEPCPECGGPRFKNSGIVVDDDGRKFRIVDKFASKDSTPVGQNVRRFALEEISA